ncbi:hypothetical protein [Rhizosphaericola mali]|uniref:Uncharacterized protein n=1 Tax=Rhizosphaericola mali TaxID=2545455 RepID=A0A5P2G6N0_9BACT|nr:hypothetical protein [Rhizosphaericola mali]QES88883.1 hypothetical protein E0W69_009515 [Rhizosphaericola mali]
MAKATNKASSQGFWDYIKDNWLSLGGLLIGLISLSFSAGMWVENMNNKLDRMKSDSDNQQKISDLQRDLKECQSASETYSKKQIDSILNKSTKE